MRHYQVPVFLLPAPSAIWPAFTENFASLMGSLWVTLQVTWIAFAIALVGGLALAIVFAQSRTAENALFPYAVILQVTPIVAIAPLILIWVGFEHVERAAVIIALIVAFFPILSNATAGTALRRSGTARPVPALRRVALADFVAAAIARARCPISSPA